jgi:Zn-dependent M28 family amino/carboxypeptidase
MLSNAAFNHGKVHNVNATIPRSVSNKVIVVGNHHAAWGPGAGDGNSGSAALNAALALHFIMAGDRIAPLCLPAGKVKSLIRSGR